MFSPSFQVFPQNHQVLLCGFALPGNWGEFAEICNEGLAATENSSKNRENFDFYHIQNLSLVIHIYINLSGERIFLGLGRAWSCQWRVHRSLSSKPAAGPRPGGAPAKLSNSNSGRSDAFFFFFFFGRMLTAHSRTALSPLAKETVLGKLTMEGGGEGALGTSPGENIWLKNFY